MEVLKFLRRGEAPGLDGILNEMLMYGGGTLVEVMLQVMNLLLRSEFSPEAWKRGLLVPLHKNGDNEEVGNYSGIALVCSMAKVFMRVMARRLGRFAEDRILKKQREGLGVIGVVQSVVGVEVCVSYGKGRGRHHYLAFLDVSKAYDSVWREGLWCMMRHCYDEALWCRGEVC